MYQGKDFQEADKQMFYSGRRIRRTTIGEMQNHQQENVKSLVPQEENEKRYEKPTNLHTIGFNNNKEISGTTTELISSLERNLTGYTPNHLICVFGINSNEIVKEAIEEVECRIQEKIFILPKSYNSDDEFRLFATTMYNFIQKALIENDSFKASRLSQTWINNRLIQYLIEIGKTDDEYDFDILRRLEIDGNKFARGEKCKEILKFIKEQIGRNDAKFIWNIEIDSGELNYKFLKNISQIVGDDLIIIINSLMPVEAEVSVLGAGLRYGDSTQTGFQLMDKYVCFQDIIRAD